MFANICMHNKTNIYAFIQTQMLVDAKFVRFALKRLFMGSLENQQKHKIDVLEALWKFH